MGWLGLVACMGTMVWANAAHRLGFDYSIVAAPSDVAAKSAYADYLIELGDPQGELIAASLSLRNSRLSRRSRAELRNRIETLKKEYLLKVLGAALPVYLLGDWRNPFLHFEWEDGFVVGLELYSVMLRIESGERLLRLFPTLRRLELYGLWNGHGPFVLRDHPYRMLANDSEVWRDEAIPLFRNLARAGSLSALQLLREHGEEGDLNELRLYFLALTAPTSEQRLSLDLLEQWLAAAQEPGGLRAFWTRCRQALFSSSR